MGHRGEARRDALEAARADGRMACRGQEKELEIRELLSGCPAQPSSPFLRRRRHIMPLTGKPALRLFFLRASAPLRALPFSGLAQRRRDAEEPRVPGAKPRPHRPIWAPFSPGNMQARERP